MAAEVEETRTPKPEPTWELVLKRNPVERLKQEKAPLGIRDELPALIAAGYESVPEEDIVRLQWWGLYHDKPKIGTFMLRIKLPSGHLTPAKLRAIGEVSNKFGKGDGELATRQNIQLHWLELARLPDVFAHLDSAGITTAGGCGDTVRNITGCPVQGLDPGELFDCSERGRGGGELFYGNPDFCDLPRKHKYTIAACSDRCNAPEINCVALLASSTRAARASQCASEADSPRCPGSLATWASSSRRSRRSRSSARSRAPGRTTSAIASRE